MRLFVAINVPARERRRLFRAAARLREAELPVRWVPADAFHITMKFLGEVRPEDVDRVGQAVSTVAAKSRRFEVRLGGFGAFPTLRRPRIVWAGAESAPQLRFLKHDLEWGLSKLGFSREVRAFHPHITLGRAREGANAGHFRNLPALIAGLRFEATLRVGSLHLMHSRTGAGGARYERIAMASLGRAIEERAKEAPVR